MAAAMTSATVTSGNMFVLHFKLFCLTIYLDIYSSVTFQQLSTSFAFLTAVSDFPVVARPGIRNCSLENGNSCCRNVILKISSSLLNSFMYVFFFLQTGRVQSLPFLRDCVT